MEIYNISQTAHMPRDSLLAKELRQRPYIFAAHSHVQYITVQTLQKNMYLAYWKRFDIDDAMSFPQELKPS